MYGYGSWSIAFVVLIALLLVGYPWGYRVWGPWYRRRVPLGGRQRVSDEHVRSAREAERRGALGALSAIVWVALVIATFWLLFALAWGAR